MTTVIDQLVTAPEQDQRHVGLRGAELVGYLPLGHGASKTPNLGDFFGRQEFFVMRDFTDINRMLSVQMASYPLQISDDVIGFNAVNMVDHRKAIRIWNERKCNEPVNVDGFDFPIPEEVDVLVTELVCAGSQDLSINSASLQTVADSVKATNSAKIADFVKISEVFDRDRSPFFCESDIHTTGCPSGNDGLAIKDPSHAATFGGSAIMAAASEIYNRRLQFL